MDPATLGLALKILDDANSFATTLINSQPADVKLALWQRHMVVTEPLYLIAAKIAGVLDSQLGGAPPTSTGTVAVVKS